MLVLCHTLAPYLHYKPRAHSPAEGGTSLHVWAPTTCHVTPRGALGCAPAERGGGGGGVEFGCFA